MPETMFENKQEALVARSRADEPDHHNTLMIRRDAKLAFLLFTEAGLHIHDQRDFKITGDCLEVAGTTNDEGKFELAGVPYGLYELFVGEARFVLPAVHPDDVHLPVHVPYYVLPDIRDAWLAPDADELDDTGDSA